MSDDPYDVTVPEEHQIVFLEAAVAELTESFLRSAPTDLEIDGYLGGSFSYEPAADGRPAQVSVLFAPGSWAGDATWADDEHGDDELEDDEPEDDEWPEDDPDESDEPTTPAPEIRVVPLLPVPAPRPGIGPPSAQRRPLWAVHDNNLSLDYGQFAMISDECDEDRRSDLDPPFEQLGVTRGILYLNSEFRDHQPEIVLEAWSAEPPDDTADWHDVAQLEMELPGSTVSLDAFEPSGGPALSLPPSADERYGVRVVRRTLHPTKSVTELVEEAFERDQISGAEWPVAERWRLQLWPASPPAEPDPHTTSPTSLDLELQLTNAARRGSGRSSETGPDESPDRPAG